MHALVLLFLAQPGDVVQVHDLGRLSWQRAKALGDRRVRVRFVVALARPTVWEAGGDKVVEVVDVWVTGPGHTHRAVILPRHNEPALTRGARLEAEGFLRVKWRPPGARGEGGYYAIYLENARLVK